MDKNKPNRVAGAVGFNVRTGDFYVFRSKAVGEPPLLLAISHFLALKEAIKVASSSSNPEVLNSPATPSEILKAINGLTS